MPERHDGTTPRENSMAHLLLIRTQVRCLYLQGLISDSLELRHGIEKAKTMLIRFICFDVSLSGLPGQLLSERLCFLQSAKGKVRGVCENSLFLLKAKIHRVVLKVCSWDYQESQIRLCFKYVHLNTSLKIDICWLRTIQSVSQFFFFLNTYKTPLFIF